MAESTPELSGTQEYYVLLITDEQGEATGIHWFEHRKFGNVLWLFSSMEVVEKFRGGYVDENQAFMDILERDFNQLREGATDINFFRAVSKREFCKHESEGLGRRRSFTPPAPAYSA